MVGFFLHPPFIDLYRHIPVPVAGHHADRQTCPPQVAFHKFQEDSLHDLGGLIGGGLRQDNGKFIASEPETHVNTVADAFGEDFTQGDEHAVSFLMSIGIVEFLEVIDIDDGQENLIPLPVCPFNLLRETLVKCPSVP